MIIPRKCEKEDTNCTRFLCLAGHPTREQPTDKSCIECERWLTGGASARLPDWQLSPSPARQCQLSSLWCNERPEPMLGSLRDQSARDCLPLSTLGKQLPTMLGYRTFIQAQSLTGLLISSDFCGYLTSKSKTRNKTLSN